MRIVTYLKARLGEKTTLAGVITALTAASAIPAPWCYVIAALGVLAVLYPEDKPNAA